MLLSIPSLSLNIKKITVDRVSTTSSRIRLLLTTYIFHRTITIFTMFSCVSVLSFSNNQPAACSTSLMLNVSPIICHHCFEKSQSKNRWSRCSMSRLHIEHIMGVTTPLHHIRFLIGTLFLQNLQMKTLILWGIPYSRSYPIQEIVKHQHIQYAENSNIYSSFMHSPFGAWSKLSYLLH